MLYGFVKAFLCPVKIYLVLSFYFFNLVVLVQMVNESVWYFRIAEVICDFIFLAEEGFNYLSIRIVIPDNRATIKPRACISQLVLFILEAKLFCPSLAVYSFLNKCCV